MQPCQSVETSRSLWSTRGMWYCFSVYGPLEYRIMSAVCIIGAGEIGGAAAHALARSERVSRVLLVDGEGKIAAGKALDIQQSGAVDGFHVRLDGTTDMSGAAGCSVYVVADR